MHGSSFTSIQAFLSCTTLSNLIRYFSFIWMLNCCLDSLAVSIHTIYFSVLIWCFCYITSASVKLMLLRVDAIKTISNITTYLKVSHFLSGEEGPGAVCGEKVIFSLQLPLLPGDQVFPRAETCSRGFKGEGTGHPESFSSFPCLWAGTLLPWDL